VKFSGFLVFQTTKYNRTHPFDQLEK
jgi:hypothetical protein